MTSIRFAAVSGMVILSLLIIPTPSLAQSSNAPSKIDSLTAIVRGAAAFLTILAVIDAFSGGARHHRHVVAMRTKGHRDQHVAVVRKAYGPHMSGL